MIEYIIGDVRNHQTEGVRIIPHCCNDSDAMGAGVAKALYDRWPKVKEKYHAGQMELGSTSFATIKEDGVIVVNMIAQHQMMVGHDENGIAIGPDGRPPIRYEALVQAMKMVRHHAETCIGHGVKVEIHCPQFGCDLAGGDWHVVSALIEEMWCKTCKVICFVLDKNKIPQR